jgi:hypothetical protein
MVELIVEVMVGQQTSIVSLNSATALNSVSSKQT